MKGFFSLLLLGGCLERITSDPPPLDPRFYEQDDNKAAQGEGNETLMPFADYEGSLVTIRGEVISDKALPVDMDLWKVPLDAPGNREYLGKIPLTMPGDFKLEVPESFGPLTLEAYIDIGGDGPTDDDPFGQVSVTVADGSIDDVEIEMIPGGRGQASLPPNGGDPNGGNPNGAPDASAGAVHVPAAPGAPGGAQPGSDAVAAGGDAAAGAVSPWEAEDPFAEISGPRVTIAGTILFDTPDVLLDMDIFRSDPAGPGGRVFVGKIKRNAGPFSFEVPISLGQIILDVFQDVAGDGPSATDPFAACPCNPVDLSKGAVQGIEIRVSAGSAPP